MGCNRKRTHASFNRLEDSFSLAPKYSWGFVHHEILFGSSFAQAVGAVNYLTRIAFGTALVTSVAVVWLAIITILSSANNDRDNRWVSEVRDALILHSAPRAPEQDEPCSRQRTRARC